MTTISTKEVDYLDQDPQLRGQNYVCLSFISPEEILKKKEVYFMEKFIENFSFDMSEFFSKLSEKYNQEVDLINTIKERYRYIFDPTKIQDEYQYFINTNGSTLESEFHEKNDFQTSIRGLKIRGTFDSQKEAEIRAQVLKRIDDKFHVYIAQVGCWCPWSPNPDDIADQEYAETHLNTLMKSYKENQNKKDIFFEERKRDLQFQKTKTEIEDKDQWTKNKEDEEKEISSEVKELVDKIIDDVVTSNVFVDEQVVVPEVIDPVIVDEQVVVPEVIDESNVVSNDI